MTTTTTRPMVPMTVDEFNVHQINVWVHPYTCGNDSAHPPLWIENDDLSLRCIACDYVQEPLTRPARERDVIE